MPETLAPPARPDAHGEEVHLVRAFPGAHAHAGADHDVVGLEQKHEFGHDIVRGKITYFEIEFCRAGAFIDNRIACQKDSIFTKAELYAFELMLKPF